MASRTPHSHHILPTSANLLGFTFVVLTSMHVLGVSTSGVISLLTGCCVVLFAVSTLLSFMSIRSDAQATMINYEKWAERVFFVALIVCVCLSLALIFDLDIIH